jgi:stearoyl-CoA desaturase (delta-9 desaturase)
LCSKYIETNTRLIKDLVRYPELRFLDRYHALPPALLAIALVVLGSGLQVFAPSLHTSGLQLLVWGFCISTVLVYHGTFIVNSLAHVVGYRSFSTKDESRNNLLIALITFGEGWHNNHHFAPSSERQGFYWWEIDISHLVLTIFSWCGVVWDLKTPPRRVYQQLPTVSLVGSRLPDVGAQTHQHFAVDPIKLPAAHAGFVRGHAREYS